MVVESSGQIRRRHVPCQPEATALIDERKLGVRALQLGGIPGRLIEDVPQNEQDGGAAHVAEIAQRLPGRQELLGGQPQLRLDLVQDAVPAGVYGPVPDSPVGKGHKGGFVGQQRCQCTNDAVVNDVGDLAVQHRLKAVVVGVPSSGSLAHGRQDCLNGPVRSSPRFRTAPVP